MQTTDECSDLRDELHSILQRTDGLWKNVWPDEGSDVSPREIMVPPEQADEDESELEAHLRRIGALTLEVHQRGGEIELDDSSSDESGSPSLDAHGDASAEDVDTFDCEDASEPHDDEAPTTEEETVEVTSEDREQLERALEGGDIESNHDDVIDSHEDSARALREIRQTLEDRSFDPDDVRGDLELLSNFISAHREQLTALDHEACTLVLRHLASRYARIRELPTHHTPCECPSRCSQFLRDIHDFLDNRVIDVPELRSEAIPHKDTWREEARRHLDDFDEYLVDYFGEHPIYEDTGVDKERLLTDVEHTVRDSDCGSSELREVVYRALEHGLSSDNERLLNLLDPHMDLVRLAGLDGIEWALEQRCSDEDGEAKESRFVSIQEALGAADEEFELLHVLKKARKSSAKSDSEHADKVYQALRAIARVGGEYFETRARGESMGGSWSMKLKEHGLKHAPGECQVTGSMYGEQRSFHGHKMERHVTLGQGGDNCVQIYFALDGDGGRIVIGHCGDHLDHYQGD